MSEPRWIAYELHDGLMQWIIGARMHVAGLVSALKEQRPTGDMEQSLSQILAFLNQATEEGRHLIRFIEGLEEGENADVAEALSATCEILTRKVREGQPQLEFNRPDCPWPQLAPDQAWNIVRIVQQAIVNAMRHSHGTLVRVNMDHPDGQLRVRVSDDGCGFDPQAEYAGHFGLKSMRQRAREAGMQFEIKSSPSGTVVTLALSATKIAG